MKNQFLTVSTLLILPVAALGFGIGTGDDAEESAPVAPSVSSGSSFGGGLSSRSSSAVRGVLSPSAEFAGYVDALAMSQSSIVQSLEANPIYQQLEAMSGSDDMLPRLGLAEEDITAMAFSFTGMDAAMKQDPTGISAQFAIATAKPVSAEALNALLQEKAAEDGVTLATTNIAGQSFFSGRKSPDEPELLFATMANGSGSIVVGGTRNGMDGAVNRLASGIGGQSGAIADALDDAMPNPQAWAVFTLPPSIRAMMQQQMDPNSPNAPPFAAMAANLMAEARAVTLTMATSNTFDMQLGLQFSSETKATEFAAFINGMLDSMLRPMLAQQPDVPQAVKDMRIETTGLLATVDLALTEEDLAEVLMQVGNTVGVANP